MAGPPTLDDDADARGRLLQLRGCLIACGVLLAVVVAIAALTVRPWWQIPFDGAVWGAACRPETRSSRWRMLDDLQGRLLRPGMSKRAVLDVLGPPGEDFGFPSRVPGTLRYCTGRFVVIDYDYLEVDFDAADRVIATRVRNY